MTIDWTVVGSIATAIGSLATAAAVLVAGRQLQLSRQQATSSFEDQLEREYRDIVAQLPVTALLGQPLEGPLSEQTLTAFYRFVDLTNQQIFLRQHHRISTATWMSWQEAIAHNLMRPAFAAAWAHSKDAAPKDFDELRRLERNGFDDDPSDWPEGPADHARQPPARSPGRPQDPRPTASGRDQLA